MVTGSAKGRVMPPIGARLTATQIDVVRAWIDQGADWPEIIEKPLRASSTHWSFQPIRRPEPPSTPKRDWVRNPIDAFVLARLEAEGLEPSPEADKRTLARRVFLDLIGLPPSPTEVEAFLSNNRTDSYEDLVDRLLQSPHYGEKWARPWLDQAHYADSDGYDRDLPRPHAWRYRHWVIQALNGDLPFDRITIEQIAGDLLPHSTVEQKVATGFLRNTLSNRESGAKLEQFRHEQIVDRTNTVGTVWLGLTVRCAQCHDHKYDPISQKEYYQLFAFFNPANEVNIEAPLPGELGPSLRGRSEYYRQRQKLLDAYHATEIQSEWERRLVEAADHPGKYTNWDAAFENFEKKVDYGEKLLRVPSLRNRHQQDFITDHLIEWYHLVVDEEGYKQIRFKELQKKLAELKASFPDVSLAPTIAEGPNRRKTHISLRGDYLAKGIEVEPGTPSVLPALSSSRPSRLELAQWLVSSNNPLTARVIVNRIWQELFGQGLVTTPEDFGTQGAKPSHPELLDWLASEFRERGWSLKQVIKQIVLSATYRQSSNVRPELQSRDPYNILLARQSAFRLPAELIRDSTLSASGLLYPAIGGRSVFPPQPEAVIAVKQGYDPKWEESQGKEGYRRGLYIHFQRTTPYPLLQNFDAPDASESACRRQRSNTPLQALNLLNDPVFFEAAQALAQRTLTEAPSSAFQDRLSYAFQLCLGRNPEPLESKSMLVYLARLHVILQKEPTSVPFMFPVDLPGMERTEAAAWAGLSRVLLNLDEFLTRE
jgi:hypothetical protein